MVGYLCTSLTLLKVPLFLGVFAKLSSTSSCGVREYPYGVRYGRGELGLLLGGQALLIDGGVLPKLFRAMDAHANDAYVQQKACDALCGLSFRDKPIR